MFSPNRVVSGKMPVAVAVAVAAVAVVAVGGPVTGLRLGAVGRKDDFARARGLGLLRGGGRCLRSRCGRHRRCRRFTLVKFAPRTGRHGTGCFRGAVRPARCDRWVGLDEILHALNHCIEHRVEVLGAGRGGEERRREGK